VGAPTCQVAAIAAALCESGIGIGWIEEAELQRHAVRLDEDREMGDGDVPSCVLPSARSPIATSP
jgi:hypothetical protein